MKYCSAAEMSWPTFLPPDVRKHVCLVQSPTMMMMHGFKYSFQWKWKLWCKNDHSHPLIVNHIAIAISVKNNCNIISLPDGSAFILTAPLHLFHQASFPGNLHLVLVLRPTSFFQRTVTDLGFRFSQEDFMLKMPVRQHTLSYQTCPPTPPPGTRHSPLTRPPPTTMAFRAYLASVNMNVCICFPGQMFCHQHTQRFQMYGTHVHYVCVYNKN